jgi:hypothetical protein
MDSDERDLVYSGSGPEANRSASAVNDAPDPSYFERTVLSPGSVLFPTEDMDQFRARWLEIQAGFVDEPRRAVEQANALVGLVIQHLMDMFTNERAKLENLWGQGKDVSTEDLRQALRRYRSFFDRLLSV